MNIRQVVGASSCAWNRMADGRESGSSSMNEVVSVRAIPTRARAGLRANPIQAAFRGVG